MKQNRERLLELKAEFRREHAYDAGILGVGLGECDGRACLLVSVSEGVRLRSEFKGLPVVTRVGSLASVLVGPLSR
jgi:hypothetical protein